MKPASNPPTSLRPAWLWVAVLGLGLLMANAALAAPAGQLVGATQFRKDIQPNLQEFCYDCHADGANKGQVTLDEFKSDQALLGNDELWLKVLKNLRADLMPPPKKPQPTRAQKLGIEQW